MSQTAETIGELLASQAEAQGDRPFLLFPASGETLSFAATAARVAELIKQLRAEGFCAGDRVATLLPNGQEAALTLLAIMAGGGVAVPLNPRLTAPEISQALGQSAARFVITAGTNTGPSPLEGSAFTRRTAANPAGQAVTLWAERTATTPTASGAALILFTSGTTGSPKGVVLSHTNLLTNAGFVREAHQLTTEDIALCVLPLFHINGLVVTLLTPLLSGHSVIIPERFEVNHFWELIAHYRATWFSAVPTILSLLLSHPSPQQMAISSLRFARSASAPLPMALLTEFEQRFAVPVIETYGISEAACQVTANPLPPLPRKPGSAGRPVGNRLLIVDESGAGLPTGGTGEVVILGANVFSGYLDNPAADLEALRFGWFHSGDLGYLDSDGYLFLTGRKKELINRAGEKISPREVEEVIHRLPQVEAVAVVGVPHPLYGEEVTAFITLRPEAQLETEQIRCFCHSYLASFKVPREVFYISEFPKGPSGKIQRRHLVQLYADLKREAVNEKNV